MFAYTEPSLIVAGEEPGVALGQKPAGVWDLQVEGTPQGLVSPPPQESMHLQSR